MSKVPAWKRLGLKVKEEQATEDPFAVNEHFDGSVITNKVAKKLNKKRQLEEGKTEKTKKPPKRVKQPKSERGPPPEKDQLSYLRQFAHDKENWKFSKQKQNWLLKNIENIPSSYENDLIAYFEDIQGGARTRVEEDLRAVINEWNEYSKKLEEKINAELYGDKEEEKEEGSKETDSPEEKKDEPVKESAPSKEYASRCKKLLSAMLEEPVHMEGETEDAEDTVEKTIEEPTTVENEPEKVEATPESKDNLIIEEVEVEEYDKRNSIEQETPSSSAESAEVKGDEDTLPKETVKKEEKKAKKEKKSKKNKKEKN